jgi:glycosyltransferase involved in cell wall biosynthesis
VVPNFVSDRTLRDQRRDTVDTPELPDPPFVLFAGDMTPDKGVDILLEAHAGLPDAPPLVFLGRPYSPPAGAPSRNVRVLGLRDHATVLEAARRSAVTVVPSLLPEAFGLIALEAMAMGTPVVAARSGALPEIVEDGATGLLVPPGDVDALRDALERLLSDQALRRQMGAAARRRAEQFSESTVVPRLERVYRDLIRPRSSGDGATAPSGRIRAAPVSEDPGEK